VTRGRLAKLIAVYALFGLWGWILVAHVDVRTNLDFFKPRSVEPAVQFLWDKLSKGPASGLILLALSDGPRDRLAQASDRMAARLQADEHFLFVTNGRLSVPPELMDALFRHRYLVAPAVEPADFSVAALRADLQQAVRRLSTLSGMATARLLPADPTDRVGRIAEHWRGRRASGQGGGVWFSPDGRRALLMVQTGASGLDLEAQQAAQAAIQEAFATADESGGLKLEMTGPAIFAIQSSRQIRGDLQMVSLLSTALVLGLLLAAFRSPSTVVVIAVPITAGILAGMSAVQLIYGQIHGIALTFGITLIGVAVDYPIHLAAHQSGPTPPPAAIRRIWPMIRLGALTTIAGFLPITLSSFPGLTQMGVFAIAGLIVAAATTRWVIPALLPPAREAEPRPFTVAWLPFIDGMRRLRLPALVAVGAVVVYVAAASRPLFDDDLSRLSPAPQAARTLDRDLRRAAGAPDVRYLLLIEGETADQVLQRSEDLVPSLDGLIRDGVLAGFDMAADYLPSARTQRRRQQALPEPAVLRAALAQASAGLSFREDAFAPFLRDVEAARTAAPMTYETLVAAGLGWLVEPLLSRVGDRWIAVVAPTGLNHPGRLAELVANLADPQLRFLDLKQESDQLVSGYRQQALYLIGFGIAALIVVLVTGLRSAKVVLAVSAPIAVSVAMTTGVLFVLLGGLSLFNLLALLLVTGVGLDYALFFNRYTADPLERAKALRAILICCGTTISVFAALASSQMPVLHGIGLTVTAGTLLSLLLTPIFAAARSTR